MDWLNLTTKPEIGRKICVFIATYTIILKINITQKITLTAFLFLCVGLARIPICGLINLKNQTQDRPNHLCIILKINIPQKTTKLKAILFLCYVGILCTQPSKNIFSIFTCKHYSYVPHTTLCDLHPLSHETLILSNITYGQFVPMTSE